MTFSSLNARRRLRAFGRGSRAEARRISGILRRETVGGGLLVFAALVAVVLANSPAASVYESLRELRIGPAALHLDLTLGAWASDGLLALFFFLVGLELKHEFVAGDLRNVRRAVVPVVAALGGVAVPALIFVALNAVDPAALRGWAIPTATDIAFALAVLAVIGSHLPGALRVFLLTLAVVDDLVAVVIIAVFYTDTIVWSALGLAVLPVAAYGWLVHRFRGHFARNPMQHGLVLAVLGVLAWGLLHSSGVHATIAGVALGLMVPVKRHRVRDHEPSIADRLDRWLRPISAGFAVPVFAFFAAGVHVGGPGGLVEAFSRPVTLGILLGLVLGKPLGIVASTWVVTRLTRAELDDSVAWIDVIGVGLLGGIGFTVSLLVSELSFGAGTPDQVAAKTAVLSASVLSALLAGVLLAARNRRYRALEASAGRGERTSLA